MNPASLIVSFLFPRLCHICGLTLSGPERYVCTSCLSRMPRTLYHRVPDNPMERRFAGLFPFDRATGHFFYSRGSDLALLMADLKYRRFRGLGRYLGKVVAGELFTTGFFAGVDYLLPVPMHIFKQARRGYNQAVEICRGISEVTAIPVFSGLKAVRPHRTQTALTLAERRHNTEAIFRLDRAASINNHSVLLVDDVCTTGSTLTSAAEAVIAAAPSARISLLTLGVTF